MIKRLLVAILVFFIGFDVFSQSLSWNEYNKYWYYRYRLVNNFLVRGEESPQVCDQPSGYSIPAEAAFYAGNDLHWGDATLYLGWYMGVLATEYKLLTNSGQSTENTKRELYFAMKAYERLDRKSARLFYPQIPSANCSDTYLNGLFVRDDVGTNAFQSSPEFRARYEAFTLPGATPGFSLSSDYVRADNGVLKRNSYPSQDQIAHLFIGFSLVKKCLGSASYQGYNFVQQAINYTNKIASRLDNNFWVGHLENGESYQNNTNFVEEHTAYGAAKAAEWITGNSYTSKFGFTSPLFTQISGWQKYGDPFNGPPIMSGIYFGAKIDFTPALLQAYAAIGSSWEYGLIAVRKDYTITVPGTCVRYIWGVPFPYPCVRSEVTVRCYSYELNAPGFLIDLPVVGCSPVPLPSVVVPVTNSALSSYGITYKQHIYALLHEYLHGIPNKIESNVYASMINNAPCDGPHHKPQNNPTDAGVNGWRASNRWVRPLHGDGFNDYDNVETEGEYNGLDYMLLYNLYLLSRGNSGISEYKNRLNQVSASTITAAGKYWSYETLDFSGVISSTPSTNANVVEIAANETVTLKPGFRIEAGAKARIYIEDHTACNTTQGQSSALRTTTEKPEPEPDPEQMQAQMLAEVQQQLQKKLDSIGAAYGQTATPSGYTPLNEYLTRRSETANENAEAEQRKEITAYPNPTLDDFALSFYLNADQNIEVTMTSIYDHNGITLFNGPLKQGMNTLNFDGKSIRKGVFIIEIKGPNFHGVKRILKLER
jgi:hypothetical protein